MEALNAHYGVSVTDPRADYPPVFLYYADAPKPPIAATGDAAGTMVSREITPSSGHG